MIRGILCIPRMVLHGKKQAPLLILEKPHMAMENLWELESLEQEEDRRHTAQMGSTGQLAPKYRATVIMYGTILYLEMGYNALWNVVENVRRVGIKGMPAP